MPLRNGLETDLQRTCSVLLSAQICIVLILSFSALGFLDILHVGFSLDCQGAQGSASMTDYNCLRHGTNWPLHRDSFRSNSVACGVSFATSKNFSLLGAWLRQLVTSCECHSPYVFRLPHQRYSPHSSICFGLSIPTRVFRKRVSSALIPIVRETRRFIPPLIYSVPPGILQRSI